MTSIAPVSVMPSRQKQAGVVAASLVALSFSLNPVMVSLTAFVLVPMRIEFGWSTTMATSGVTLCYAAAAFAAPLIGRLISKLGSRRVAPLLSGLFAILVAMLALLPPDYPLFLTLMTIIGLAGAGTTPFSYLTLLPRWFDRRLGLALGIATTGIGFGQVMIPQFLEILNGQVGWRFAAVALAVVMLVFVLPASWLWYREPEVEDVGRRLTDNAGMTLAEAARTRRFWFMGIAFFIVSTVAAGCMFNVAPMMAAIGFDARESALILSLSGMTMLVARSISGYLLDVISARILAAFCFGGVVLGLLMLWSGTSLLEVALGTIFIWIGVGAEGDLIPYMVRRYFGLRAYARIYGVFGTIFGAGPLLGPITVAVAHDHGVGYGPIIAAFAVAGVVAAALMAVMPDPRADAKKQGEGLARKPDADIERATAAE